MSILQNLLPRLTAHTVFVLQQTVETDLEVIDPPGPAPSTSVSPRFSSVKWSSSLQGVLSCCTPSNIFIITLFTHIRMCRLTTQWQLLAAQIESKSDADPKDLCLSPSNAQLHLTETSAVFDEN